MEPPPARDVKPRDTKFFLDAICRQGYAHRSGDLTKAPPSGYVKTHVPRIAASGCAACSAR